MVQPAEVRAPERLPGGPLPTRRRIPKISRAKDDGVHDAAGQQGEAAGDDQRAGEQHQH